MFGEGLAYHGVQGARALEAVPERLLDDHPHPRRCPGIPLLGRNAAPVEVTDYLRVHAGWDRQVEQAAPSPGGRAVPVHTLQPRAERGEIGRASGRERGWRRDGWAAWQQHWYSWPRRATGHR